jgi:hypothetical protein
MATSLADLDVQIAAIQAEAAAKIAALQEQANTNAKTMKMFDDYNLKFSLLMDDGYYKPLYVRKIVNGNLVSLSTTPPAPAPTPAQEAPAPTPAAPPAPAPAPAPASARAAALASAREPFFYRTHNKFSMRRGFLYYGDEIVDPKGCLTPCTLPSTLFNGIDIGEGAKLYKRRTYTERQTFIVYPDGRCFSFHFYRLP